MKTTGMSHQLEALRRMNGREAFALLMEQGTGKTWTDLADTERLFSAGLIDALLVIAPKGVHTNWIRREIPTHLSVPWSGASWKSGAGRQAVKDRDRALWTKVDGPRPLRVLTINFDALSLRDAWALVTQFLRVYRTKVTVDESSRIKTPDAKRSERVIDIRPHAVFRRIMSGTPITKQPADIFNQFEFLESGLLGTTNYRAFVAEYADLVQIGPAYEAYRKIKSGQPTTAEERVLANSLSWSMKKQIDKNPRMRFAQIVEKNPDGTPRWKNLDKLSRLIEPHSFRVLKKDCLDLPPKVYTTHYFEMSPAQRAAYSLLERDLRIRLESGELEPVAALASLVKLSQLTSGFVVSRDGSLNYVEEEATPRLQALLEKLEDLEGKVIIWARFREEIASIRRALDAAGRRVVEYHGGIKEADREAAIDAIQKGDAEVFLGQAQAGGIGITLTAATTTIYYSCDFNAETRLQSEDRNHRIGATGDKVLYIDLVAEDTIDEAIAKSHQAKVDMAAAILDNRSLDVGALREEFAAIIELPQND